MKRLGGPVRALACGLALLLLLFGVLASDSTFHQALHQGSTSGSNTCLICLFAKGQVDFPEPAPLASISVQVCFAPVVLRDCFPVQDLTYLISASRAPPAHGFLLPVGA